MIVFIENCSLLVDRLGRISECYIEVEQKNPQVGEACNTIRTKQKRSLFQRQAFPTLFRSEPSQVTGDQMLIFNNAFIKVVF